LQFAGHGFRKLGPRGTHYSPTDVSSSSADIMITPDETGISLNPFPHSSAADTLGARPNLRESEYQFWELMNHLDQTFWVNNAADTTVLYVSPAYEKMWGRSRESLYDNSHTFRDAIHPEDRKRVLAVIDRKHDAGGYNVEYRILHPDGTVRWVWARTYEVKDGQGCIKRFAGIAEDITDRKWAEKERSRLAAIIEHAEDSIVSITLEGIIIAWNNGAERKYGYTAEEVLGRSIFILIPAHRSEEYLEAIKKVRAGESMPVYETVRRRKDGTLINFSVGISPIEARDGELAGISKISHDLSQVRKLEAQLIEAQKMEVIGQLTGGVAHDFNNILSVVLGYSELMLSDPDLPDQLQKFAVAVRHAAERGTGLTRQLLVFSRKETVQLAVLNLNDVLGEMGSLLRQLTDANVDFSVVQGAKLGAINADIGYVGQIMMNLVINARDAMPNGGKLTIATTNVSLGANYAAAHPGVLMGDYVMLSISDTGVGISDEIKERLFDPFFTTKPRGMGTGLGLSTCRTIVQRSDGHIGVRSEVGKGTTFEVYFPRVSSVAEAANRLLDLQSPPRGTETILVVEDDPSVRRLVSVVLQAQGYQVLAAADGGEGLRVALSHAGSPIRLVVSDVVMPTMGGKALAGQLEKLMPDLKFLFTSGYTDDSIALHGIVDPGVAFLSKPYTISALARRVRSLLDTEST
jgi:PAS domain S-box-containing protein